MRKIFYVPKSKDYMDYESEWKGVTGHIQTGISDNIKDFVDNPDVVSNGSYSGIFFIGCT